MDKCVVCRNSNIFQPYWPGLKRCSVCGHCIADFNFKNLDIKHIYKDSYFSGDEYSNYLSDRSVFENQFRSRLCDVKKFKLNGDLIEIGCAYGFFLEIAKENYNVRGFDVAEGPVDYAKNILGLNAECADFIDAQIEAESADIIAMWDVIEHLQRPDLVIDKVAKVLKHGGYLFITTGDIESVTARFQREKWRMIHPPTHLHYFSMSTIAEMLKKSGIQIADIRYVGSRRSLRQIAHSLLVLGKPKPSRLYSLFDKTFIGDFSFVLNTYDIMLVVGQKV